jgi:urease accessory protein
MLKATEIIRHGHWSGEAHDRVVLDETGRHRRRLRLTGEGGTAFLLDLAEATLLRDGDALRLEDGRMVEVRAASEPLYRVRALDGKTASLLRLAWHLGNRHLAAQITAEEIVIRRDHVIRAMLEGLGAVVEEIDAPFDPEGGAYAAHGGGAGHGHHHDHDHRHDGEHRGDRNDA